MSADFVVRRQQYGQIPVELLTDPDISHGAVRLYGVLWGKYATGATGEGAYPSQQTLAADLGAASRSVRRMQAQLVAAGWIVVEHRAGTSSVYHLVSEPRNDTSGGVRTKTSGGVRTKTSYKPDPIEPDPIEPTTRARGESEKRLTLVSEHVDEKSATNEEGFDNLWERWPTRRGRKIGRAQALARWRRLSSGQRARALAALPAYKSHAGEMPCDAHRWLTVDRASGPWFGDGSWDPTPEPERRKYEKTEDYPPEVQAAIDAYDREWKIGKYADHA